MRKTRSFIQEHGQVGGSREVEDSGCIRRGPRGSGWPRRPHIIGNTRKRSPLRREEAYQAYRLRFPDDETYHPLLQFLSRHVLQVSEPTPVAFAGWNYWRELKSTEGMVDGAHVFAICRNWVQGPHTPINMCDGRSCCIVFLFCELSCWHRVICLLVLSLLYAQADCPGCDSLVVTYICQRSR